MMTPLARPQIVVRLLEAHLPVIRRCILIARVGLITGPRIVITEAKVDVTGVLQEDRKAFRRGLWRW